MSAVTDHKILKAAVIGTGKISEQHLRFLSSTTGVKLVGVCDLSPALASYAAKEFGASAAYTDASKMLAQAQPDVVHVLTPPHTHRTLVNICLSGGSHVIVEKPVAPTHREFLELWELSQQKNRRLVEDHNYRFNQPILAIEKLLADGELGDVREVDVRMALAMRGKGSRYADPNLPHPSHNLPAGVIHEYITHLCYLTLRFMPEVDRVAAAWSKHADDTVFKHDDLDALVIGGPVHGRVRFTSHVQPDCFTVSVRGTRGWAETDLFQPYLRVIKPRSGGQQLSPLVNHWVNGWGLMRASVRGFSNKVMQHTPYEGLTTFLTKTYAALAADTQPPVTFRDMDRAARLVDALLDARNKISALPEVLR